MNTINIQQNFVSQIKDLQPFKQLMDLIPDVAFFLKDTHGRFVMQNRHACDYCQVATEDETIGKTDFDFFPPRRASLYVKSDQQVMESGRPIINAVAPAPENSNKMIVYSKFPVYDKDNKLIGVAGIHRVIDGLRDTPSWYGSLSIVIQYIHENYSQELTLTDLAKMAHTSQSQLERRFRQLLATTPSSYILRVRIDAGRTLLESTDRTISDIAQSVGFYDHSHFTRSFHKIMHTSPRDYRRRRSNSGE
ncbi:MAG: helix-turn-helix domain-containing protein [Kiritimatiellae bacterium]|jgi:AraC-like DNA-binding protein|nr:helix-turn-helix domain-containing protein [Kiritimatiellia bacterium]